MELTGQIVWATALYKMTCLVVGTVNCVLGFRLFCAGITLPAGDLSVEHDRLKLSLRSTAPGTFFAVLGAAIVVATIAHGLDFNLTRHSDERAAPVRGAAPPMQDEAPPPLP